MISLMKTHLHIFGYLNNVIFVVFFSSKSLLYIWCWNLKSRFVSNSWKFCQLAKVATKSLTEKSSWLPRAETLISNIFHTILFLQFFSIKYVSPIFSNKITWSFKVSFQQILKLLFMRSCYYVSIWLTDRL